MNIWTLPKSPARIHFVGIGGIGMSGLARMLNERGYRVSGSDASESPLLEELRQEGIAVSVGHTEVNAAAEADVVVRTAAVATDNPEVRAALNKNVPVLKRSELLGGLARDAKACLAIAGSHGKSTTSAMVTWALAQMDADPSYAIGAVLQSTGRNSGNGAGEAFVVEADEFDRSFLTLWPDHAIVTNIEFDHPDIFPDQDSYDDAFLQFVSQVDPEGTVIVPHDDEGIRRISASMDPSLRDRLVTFGRGAEADWNVTLSESRSTLVTPAGRLVPLELQVPGRHNALNAAASVALLAQEGYSPEDTAEELRSFQGLERRFEYKGETNGIVVIDDYAHHPTEIVATVEAARVRFPSKRIWAVFQPHTFSRTRALAGDFADALQSADEVMLMDVFASREQDDGSVTEAALRGIAGPNGRRGGDNHDTADRLATLLKEGDVVLTMGAGDVTDLGPCLLQRLGSLRHASQR